MSPASARSYALSPASARSYALSPASVPPASPCCCLPHPGSENWVNPVFSRCTQVATCVQRVEPGLTHFSDTCQSASGADRNDSGGATRCTRQLGRER